MKYVQTSACYVRYGVCVIVKKCNHSGTETVIFWDNTSMVNAMTHCIATSPITMLLIMQDKRVIAFHKLGFQLPEPSQCFKAVENEK